MVCRVSTRCQQQDRLQQIGGLGFCDDGACGSHLLDKVSTPISVAHRRDTENVTMSEPKTDRVADADAKNWVDRFAPAATRPYLRMARLDRPIGYWLLFWPCAFSLDLAAVARPQTGFSLYYLALFFIGAVAMRGAGCTLNDIVDRDIDDKVERTRSRPIPSGQVTVRQAIVFFDCSVSYWACRTTSVQ